MDVLARRHDLVRFARLLETTEDVEPLMQRTDLPRAPIAHRTCLELIDRLGDTVRGLEVVPPGLDGPTFARAYSLGVAAPVTLWSIPAESGAAVLCVQHRPWDPEGPSPLDGVGERLARYQNGRPVTTRPPRVTHHAVGPIASEPTSAARAARSRP